MRPILIAVIGYILGIIWELYLKKSIAPIFCIITAVLFTLLYLKNNYNKKIKRFLKILKNKENLKRIIIFSSFLIFSILYVKILNRNYESNNKSLIDKEVSFICTVLSDKKESKYQDTYTAKVEYAFNKNEKIKINKKVLIRLKKQDITLNYGDRFICEGQYEKATQRSNYKGFSYEESLKSKNIYGIINTSYESVEIIKRNNINLISRLANKSRKIIIEKINNILPNDTKDLVLGFVLGYTDEMDENIKDNFRDSNLSHMLAVSGAHVSYIILGVSWVLNSMKLQKRTCKIITIFILIFFMFLTGFTPSVTRACIMGICILISGIIFRQTDFVNSISLVLLIILIYNPFAIYNIGLQLSFGGTIGIVLFSKNISNLINRIFYIIMEKNNRVIINNSNLYKFLKILKEMLAVTISAQIIIIPITILNFNTISLTFFISNILASPFMGIITIGGFLLVFISLISIHISKFLARIYNIPLIALLKIVEFCSKIPGSKIYVVTINEIFVVIYYLSVFLVNYHYSILMKNNKSSVENLILKLFIKTKKLIRKNSKKIIIMILLLIIVISNIKFIIRKSKGLQIYMVDVGQGDCSVIITPNNKKIIVDGGGSNTQDSSYDVGESVVFPYLLDRKIKSLDYVIISHFDSDHCKGLEYVLKNMQVKTAIIPKQFEEYENYNEFIKIAKDRKINVLEVKAGEKIQIDKDIYIYILWPTEDYIQENVINNNSIVFKLYYKNFSALFTGDIEEEAEKEILAKYEKVKLKNEKILQSDLLKVAHHGSKSSSTEEFIENVKPKICLIGVGKYNTFGHPNAYVIERLKSIGAEVLRTDINGEIKIRINTKGRVEIKSFCMIK